MAPETPPLYQQSARAVVAALRDGQITPHDAIDAVEARWQDVDKAVNAMPTTCFDRARAAADALLQKPVEERGLLAGLPVAIKDLSDVAGVRSTQGSPIFADHVPEHSAFIVTTIEAAGGIVTGKTNTPEFGAGANTFNPVFGATRNPWNTALSAAGSSGGSAVALATGTAWLAHGSDLGGSLRNPASFNGIVGLRPSPGRVASGPLANLFDTLGMDGPMARDVPDLALLLDAMAVTDTRAPLSLETPARSFLAAAEARTPPRRVAFSPDLGITPVDSRVEACCRDAVAKLADQGVEVIEAHPDFSEAHEAFQILRAHGFASALHDLYEHKRDQLKPEVVWNIEKGLDLTGGEIARAERQRSTIFARVAAFMEEVDLLLTPATIVPAYPVEERYVTACNGVEFSTYIDWLAIAYAITLTGLPALSVPAGLTPEGLPVGLQMVGRTRGEAMLLSHAAWTEETLGRLPTPIDPCLSPS
ncbi:MAG: amidase [Candidatus Puniceispirillales bacterium]